MLNGAFAKFNEKFKLNDNNFNNTTNNNELSNNKHNRYFSSIGRQVENNFPNEVDVEGQHPILRNGFMRPQIANSSTSTTPTLSNVNNSHIIYSKPEISQQYFLSSRNYSSGSITSTLSSSSSNFVSNQSANSNSRPQNSKIFSSSTSAIIATTTPGGGNSALSSGTSNLANQIETLLDSKKAREAFFERLRSESLKVKTSTISPRSSATKTPSNENMVNARLNEGKIEKIIVKPPQPPSTLAKHFDVKNNFSNVLKIDKKFCLSESDRELNRRNSFSQKFLNSIRKNGKNRENGTIIIEEKNVGENKKSETSVGKIGTDESSLKSPSSEIKSVYNKNEENKLKNLKSLLNRRLSLNNELVDRKLKNNIEKFKDNDIIKENCINSSLNFNNAGFPNTHKSIQIQDKSKFYLIPAIK